MWKVSFFQNRAGWRLGLATWLSHKFKLRANWMARLDFCLVVLQLAWLFNSLACSARVHLLAACKPQASHEIQLRVSTSLHCLEHFFTLSHTLPLHDSHLNTGFLSVELQENLSRNKANTWLIKFNLTRYVGQKVLHYSQIHEISVNGWTASTQARTKAIHQWLLWSTSLHLGPNWPFWSNLGMLKGCSAICFH